MQPCYAITATGRTHGSGRRNARKLDAAHNRRAESVKDFHRGLFSAQEPTGKSLSLFIYATPLPLR